MQTINIQELKTQGRVYVPYPSELRDAVGKAMAAWMEFCALPEAQKKLFPYSPDAKTSGNGYELKLDLTHGDLKEDFHLRTNARDWLMEGAHRMNTAAAPAFINAALALNPLMAPLLREFATGVENELGIKGFTEDVMSYQPKWLIRFLHYFGDRKPGDEIAGAHVDKGGFTLHLWESHPGVEQLDYNTKTWKPMDLSHDETVIIPGMGLQNRSKGELRATCHRVIATEDTAKTGRYSAVCFFNFANVRFYDKATFGRLQNQAPGVFYDMPFEEFDKLFID